MPNDDFFRSFDRIYHYPIIKESIGCFLQFYHWIKSKNKVFEVTFSKIETILTTVKKSTKPIAAIKPLDQALYQQLEKFEKLCPFVLRETGAVLEMPFNIYKKILQPITNSINIAIHRSLNILSNMAILVKTDFYQLTFNIIENTFNKFIPEIDDTSSISSSFTCKNRKIITLTKKTFRRLSKIKFNEIENFDKLNNEYLQNIHLLILKIKKEEFNQVSRVSGISSSIIQLIEDIFNNSKQLEHSLSTFKIAPKDNLTIDLAASLEFLRKNISKLQIILFESKLEFISDKFFFQTNFAADQIRSGLDSFCFHLRNFINRQSEMNSLMAATLSDSYYSLDHGDLSDCTLYESDYE